MMQDFEKLGQFYLGKVFDTDNDKLGDELILYDAKDLTTHAVHDRHDRQRQDRARRSAARRGGASTGSRSSRSTPRATWAICC